MEHPWRSRPPPGNFCPVCSHSHFPFCTPPPPQYFRPPPPPPDQYFRSPLPPPPQPQASYDPFVDHLGGPNVIPYPPPPAPAQIPLRPWNGDPNYSNDYSINSNSGLDHDTIGQIGIKRMRFDNVSDGYVSSSVEDERRLRLIRDHGAVSLGSDRKYDGGYSVSDRSYEPSNFQGIEGVYHKEINYSINQNYGEPQAAYQHIENNRSLHNQSTSSVVLNHGYGNSPGADGYRKFKRGRENHESPAYDDSSYQGQQRKFSTESREFNNQFLQSHAKQQHRMDPQSSYYGVSNQSENMRLMPRFKAQPPLPTSPPPPLPVEPPRFRFSEPVASSSSASGPGSLFPVAVGSVSSFHSSYAVVSEAKTSISSHYSSKGYPNSSGYYPEEIQAVRMASSKTFNGESEDFPRRNHSLDYPKIIDASHILKHPHRANRPDHIVIILRGLSGSGKSYLAKVLRDFEVENGGTAPRIHSMDEYFMTEVEKVEESEGSRSSGSVRGKKPVTRKVMEYCYEPEMEEAYRSSMLKAFKKTLDEGTFPFIIVDDRNLRVADFAQFWATAKRSGYEVYILEATYKDPVGCAARNVHGFTQNDILKMANQWEEAPSLYMKLDIKSLLHGDDLEENGIEEVDMDTEDGNHIGDTSGSEVTNIEENSRPFEANLTTDGPSTDEQKEDGQEEHPVDEVKALGKSKWSNDLDDDDVHKTEATRGNSSALSSLFKSYSKKGKSVRWADQIGRVGFSIGAGKTANVSLVIGSGSGYNLKSNPLPEEEKLNQRYTGESRRRNAFQEQLRAERESFRAVFDKRKQRIGGLNACEE
ncbi:P-loop containing nucleoside triphosphate hydrolases superfamily protein [Perilla frutescens var. hirtella]|nr:P-loop containing nucleoside triphosphate hydrolases superfamily protein [Perilla frutescens var. hirtella]